MMFASVEREDQEPTCPYYFGAGTCNSGCWEEPVCITGEPIDGWRPRQINEPNPILIAFRIEVELQREDDGLSLHSVAATTLERQDGFECATEEACDHARRVLTRLVALS